MDWATVQAVGIVCLVAFIYGGLLLVGVKVYRDWHEKTTQDDGGWSELPEDYSDAVRRAAAQIAADSIAPEGEQELTGDWAEKTEKAEAQHRDLQALRTVRAGILEDGWIAGDKSFLRGEDIRRGLSRNPHKPGSEEARQWVRGFCQGFSKREVINPRPYMEEA